MIMIGGTDPFYGVPMPSPFDIKGQPQDPWDQGIAVFDMTDLKFKNSYQSKADPYEPPDAIQQYYNSR